MADTYTALREALAAGPTIGKLSVYHDHGWLVIGDERENVYLQVSKGTGVAKVPMAQVISTAVNAAPALLAERDALHEANEAFGRRQVWWSERMFTLEQERDALAAEVERLKHENHNLNWALGTEGYDQMATSEEQAEHDAAAKRSDEILARLAERKARFDAIVPAGSDMLEHLEKLAAEVERLRNGLRDLLTTREAEAKASMTLENATANFSSSRRESAAHLKAIVAASNAEKRARELLASREVANG